MPKPRGPRSQPGVSLERTSPSVAAIAASILNGRQVSEALVWLQDVAENPHTLEDVRGHALMLLAAVSSARRVAGSALTQR